MSVNFNSSNSFQKPEPLPLNQNTQVNDKFKQPEKTEIKKEKETAVEGGDPISFKSKKMESRERLNNYGAFDYKAQISSFFSSRSLTYNDPGSNTGKEEANFFANLQKTLKEAEPK